MPRVQNRATALHAAARCGSTAAAVFLVQAGAELERRDEVSLSARVLAKTPQLHQHRACQGGNTALLCAVHMDALDTALALVGLGADVYGPPNKARLSLAPTL